MCNSRQNTPSSCSAELSMAKRIYIKSSVLMRQKGASLGGEAP